MLVVAALLAAGLFGVRYTLDNSWYVGVDENDRVAIFTGIPEKIAGFELNEKHEVTSTTLDDLPEFLRPNVLEGIRVDSLDEAHAKIADLNDRAREFGPEATRRRSES